MNRMLWLVMAVMLTTTTATPAWTRTGIDGSERDVCEADRPAAAICGLEIPPQSD
jgi:hypothetical protein